MMQRYLPAIAKPLLLGLLGATMSMYAGAVQPQDADIFGTWQVVSALDSADITAIDDHQAKRLVGKLVIIRRDSFQFDGRVCKSPTYTRTREKTIPYFRQQMHASTENLHLPATVTAIDARCTFLFPKAGGKLMFLWNGFFFDAERHGPT